MDNTKMPDIIRVTAAIMVNDGMMLIAKRKPTARLPNLWELPGGKVEPNETPEECLKRELREEFDIDVTVGENLGSNIHTYDFGTIELMAFRANWDDGNLILRDHEEIRWAFTHELDQFDFAPADQPFVDKLLRGEIEL
ncbi:MAG: (deoxy)nucleoside triphosphate pyrophosphohydrolase [Desulfobacterales bacterium]|nr:MAG: (deoxy)nucleoside triphosphate pyrophosphohydrolase [Desulfobacterales bacterium]